MLISDYFMEVDGDKICTVCPHQCRLSVGKVGRCGVRKATEEAVVCLNYGHITAVALDPIEKKPLFHYKPGTSVLSIGSMGCNMNCPFCQNYHIAKTLSADYTVHSPEEMIRLLQSYPKEIGLAFTYNEPLVSIEFVIETARLAKEAGRFVVVVTNGMVSETCLMDLIPYVDAWNIDLKSYSSTGYDQLGGDFEAVKSTIELCSRHAHVEVTSLIVTGFNDHLKEWESNFAWLKGLGGMIPLHLSRYYPNYHYHEKETDVELLKELYKLAKTYLDYVYIGNVFGISNDTYCKKCGVLMAERDVYQTKLYHYACPSCGEKVFIE